MINCKLLIESENHPQEGPSPLAHGVLLLGLVSGVLGTRAPFGPGTVLLAMERVEFKSPCPVDAEVEVEASLEGDKRRKIEWCSFECRGFPGRDRVYVSGRCKLRMPAR